MTPARSAQVFQGCSVVIRREEPPPCISQHARRPPEALLTESRAWTGGKQQLTATRLHELLVAEGHRVVVTLVKEAVAE